MATTASHFVSVLMCSGPTSGMVFACPAIDLVHRRKKLDIGAHVLVKQRDGGKRRKGVIVHMNPLINAALAPRPAVPAPAVQGQRPTKRLLEQPQVQQVAAKRFKFGPSLPVILPGMVPQQPTAQPALLQYDHRGIARVTCLNQPRLSHHQPAPSLVVPPARPIILTRFPGRHRVRRELSFSGPQRGSGLRSIKAPVTAEELDDVVPLDFLSDFDAARGLLMSGSRDAPTTPAPFPSAPLLTTSPFPVVISPLVSPSFQGEAPIRSLPFVRRPDQLIGGNAPAIWASHQAGIRSGVDMLDDLLRDDTCPLPDLVGQSPRMH